MIAKVVYYGYVLEFIDTHCHIQSSSEGDGIDGEAVTRRLWQKAGFPAGDEIIARAAGQGVKKMICVGCDLEDSRLAAEFVESRPACYASIGIHPHEAQRYLRDGELDARKLDDFAALALRAKIVAVGECGLDYYYGHSPASDQELVLRFQIGLALRLNLPLIFHVREAFDDFWPIFDSFAMESAQSGNGLRGVLHSFTDNRTNLARAMERGLYIGINGIATFTKSAEQAEIYKNIPLSRILLETDAPFLTPSPYRGNICEPYHTSVTAEFLSGLRGEPLDQLAAATTVNARKLFNI